jgi:Fur family ferric uptake transcriptional regulator
MYNDNHYQYKDVKMRCQRAKGQGPFWPSNGCGARMTAPRQAIFRTLHEMEGHPTVDEIFAKLRLQFPGIGLATLYRNLELLRSNGHVSAFDSGDGKLRYELRQKAERPGHHHHLVCRSCHQIIDYMNFENEELELVKKLEVHLVQKYKYQVTDHDITFYGTCPNCSTERA